MEIEGYLINFRLRFNFTHNFLVGAATMARLAADIDKKGKGSTEEEQLQHKAFVAASIMQSVAALESEVWSLYNHGPGYHLGSDGLDYEAKNILSKVADAIENQSILVKYNIILKLVRNKELDLGRQPMQDLDLLIRLRNEITHFKSQWTDELDSKRLFKALEQKDATRPSFYQPGMMNFFPGICLNHIRAKWSVDTTISFIDHFYSELGIKSPLEVFNRSLLIVS